MKERHDKTPKGVITSLVFLAIAIAGWIPLLDVMNDPVWSEPQTSGYGDPSVLLALICVIAVSIPATFTS